MPSSCLDLPSPLKICGKPGEEVSPASVPENGEAVRLPMAGFPGRWLEVRCFLISPGNTAQAARAPRPGEAGRGLRPWVGVRQAWHGCWKSVAGLL